MSMDDPGSGYESNTHYINRYRHDATMPQFIEDQPPYQSRLSKAIHASDI